MRAVFQWNLGKRTLELGKRTLIMGVVNVTPDSFSDGGLFLDPQKATEHALQLLEEGADIIDIGGESTRPGARVVTSMRRKHRKAAQTSTPNKIAVSEEEELRRVLPVITQNKKTSPKRPRSQSTPTRPPSPRCQIGRGRDRKRRQRFALGPANVQDHRRNKMRSDPDAHARTSRRMAHPSSTRRHCPSRETRTQGVVRSRGAGWAFAVSTSHSIQALDSGRISSRTFR